MAVWAWGGEAVVDPIRILKKLGVLLFLFFQERYGKVGTL